MTITEFIAVIGIQTVILGGLLGALWRKLDSLSKDHVSLARELSELRGELRGKGTL